MKENIHEVGNEWDEEDYQQHLHDLASKDASKPARLSIGRTIFQFIAGVILLFIFLGVLFIWTAFFLFSGDPLWFWNGVR